MQIEWQISLFYPALFSSYYPEHKYCSIFEMFPSVEGLKHKSTLIDFKSLQYTIDSLLRNPLQNVGILKGQGSQ